MTTEFSPAWVVSRQPFEGSVMSPTQRIAESIPFRERARVPLSDLQPAVQVVGGDVGKFQVEVLEGGGAGELHVGDASFELAAADIDRDRALNCHTLRLMRGDPPGQVQRYLLTEGLVPAVLPGAVAAQG